MKQCRMDCIHIDACRRFADNSTYWNSGDCPIYKSAADVAPKSEVEKLEHEIETLKDNNEHLAVMLMEAKEEANRYKRYYFRHDYDEMIAAVLDKLDRFINSNCIEIKDERGIKGYVTSGVHFAIAELKKKYTEGEG